MASGEISICLRANARLGFCPARDLPRKDTLPTNIYAMRVLDAEEVTQFAPIRAIVNHKIGQLACFERSYLVPAI